MKRMILNMMNMLKNTISNENGALRNICAICLNSEEGVKLYKIKIIEQFFVHIVGISQMEYEKVPKLLCVWCASRVSRTMQLVSRARQSAGVLSHVADTAFGDNSLRATQAFGRSANLHNLSRSNGKAIDVVLRENVEDERTASFGRRGFKSNRSIENESPDVETNAADKSECDDSILSEDNEVFGADEREYDSGRKNRIELKKRAVKSQSRRRKKNAVKTENDIAPPTNAHESDHDLGRLQFSVRELTGEQQLAEVERRRQTTEFRDARYKCRDCALVFLCAESERNHAGRHKEMTGPYVCPICNLRFASRGVFSHHRLSHRRVIRCLLCERRLPRRSLLRRHRARCPGGGAMRDGFRCSACDREFVDRESVRAHCRRAHGGTPGALRCGHCEKAFARKYDLVVHIRSHTQEKPYSCPHCPRRFSVSSNLRAHAALVHREGIPGPRTRPYCVECDKHFTTARSLTRHLTRTAAHRQRD